MSGIVGWLNNKRNLSNYQSQLIKMNNTLTNRGPDEEGYYFATHALLGHRKLSIKALNIDKQPMMYQNYTIVYNGELYNSDSLRENLCQLGYQFNTISDSEVLLKAYIEYKERMLEKLNGIFAFAIYDGKKLFMARDRFGVRPLFYFKKGRDLIFASEIKALLASEIIKPIIDRNSLRELLALGPSKSPGNGIFKGIFELKPAHYLSYYKNKIKIKRYWQLKDSVFNDSFEECQAKIRKIVYNSIREQMKSSTDITVFLSGGLDSSIISAICSQELKKKNKNLVTYSIDYEDNEKHFKSNNFQVSQDKYYIDLIKQAFKINHQFKIIDQQSLADYLKEAMIARDLPGMADIDSSLYWLSKKVSENHKVVFSGEGADEIFGGYPWFHTPVLNNNHSFPWLRNLKEREKLLKNSIKKKLKLEWYAKKQKRKTMREAPKTKNKKERYYRNMFYLNMIWFLPTLLDRNDRMTARASLEVRIPFVNHYLIEYLWNVPWSYKNYKDREKGLLREAFSNLLPKEIITRQKNPYPKTHHPKYVKIVSELLMARLKNEDSILYKLFDLNQLLNLIKTKGKDYSTPWFGQLMTGPQLIAYLYQFDLWAEHYKIILKI